MSAETELTLFEPPAAAIAARSGRAYTGRHEATLARELCPRARLSTAGPEAMSAAELLATVLGGETERSLALASGLISQSGGLAGLRQSAASVEGLMDSSGQSCSGLTEKRAAAVAATVELGKRMVSADRPEPPVISSPKDVHELLAPRLADLDRERFLAVLLDTKNQVLATHTIAVGSLSQCTVHPREVFKPAIQRSAASIIAVHNHPSGRTAPGPEDRRVTAKLVGAGEHIGIEVLDHVVIGGGTPSGFTSMKESGPWPPDGDR